MKSAGPCGTATFGSVCCRIWSSRPHRKWCGHQELRIKHQPGCLTTKREVVMKQFRSVTSHPIGARSIPLVDRPAASSGTAIGSAVALVAGSLWAAAAFSSHNGTFYHDLAWWFGATRIGAALLGAVTRGDLPSQGRAPA